MDDENEDSVLPDRSPGGDEETDLKPRHVLLITPPAVPGYFNAGHHLPIFLVGAYLRRLFPSLMVQILDAATLSMTWKEVADLLIAQHFDVIALMNDFDTLEGFALFLRYARALSPNSRLITFGRLSHRLPDFFQRYNLDALVTSGDYEAGVAAFMRFLESGDETLPGVAIHKGQQWEQPARHGLLLPVSEWELPDIHEIPYASYDRLYSRDQNKFCGIPERRELVVPISRGCPVRCYYCEIWQREGFRERRLPVSRVISYIEESFAAAPFEYAAMYAPTFTLNKQWVRELCHELITRGARYPWKCSTTIYHLDEALIQLMADSGCVRISVGLETLDESGRSTLPKLKQTVEERFEEVCAWCRQAGIELNCLVMVGMPESTVEGAKYTFEKIREQGARVRPTIYTPYEQLRSEMSETDIIAFNRQLLTGEIATADAAELYHLVFDEDNRLTRVKNVIPARLALQTTG